MALRNAFEGIATESTLRRLLEHLRFAKDGSDRLRVSVDNNPQVVVYSNNSATQLSGGASPLPFATSTWNVVDARHEMQELSLQSFQNTRNRWSIT